MELSEWYSEDEKRIACGLVLCTDAVLLGLSVHRYCSLKQIITAIKGAVEVNLDTGLKKILLRSPGNTLNYAVIRGTVVPVGSPIYSAMSPSVNVVLQVKKLYEYGIRDFCKHSALLDMSANETPFCVQNEGVKVEVLDALSSRILDLNVIYDNYEPYTLSLFDRISNFFGFFHESGLHTTEEVLREGTFVTVIGEIQLCDSGMKIQPAKVGPMCLTKGPKSTVLMRLGRVKSVWLIHIVVYSTIGVVTIGLIAWIMYITRRRNGCARCGKRPERSVVQSTEWKL